MFEALRGMACFVTVSVSLLYGTRIAWMCGRKCTFNEDPGEKKLFLSQSLPAATLVYFCGFVIIFKLLVNGFLTIVVCSLTSAILLASLVVSMSMPELRRKPTGRQ